MVLNFKGLRYCTEWVEFPDISKRGQEIGAKPTTLNPDGSGEMIWTCPMIRDPNHLDPRGNPTVLSDSTAIVKYLEERYPQPQIIPVGSAALHYGWSQFVHQNLSTSLAKLVVPLCPAVLSERGKEYFIATRERWWGPLEEMCPDRSKAWDSVKDALDKIAIALDSNGESEKGLTVVPGKVTYADFVIIAPLLWASVIIDKVEMDALRSWNNGRWGAILDFHFECGSLRVD